MKFWNSFKRVMGGRSLQSDHEAAPGARPEDVEVPGLNSSSTGGVVAGQGSGTSVLDHDVGDGLNIDIPVGKDTPTDSPDFDEYRKSA